MAGAQLQSESTQRVVVSSIESRAAFDAALRANLGSLHRYCLMRANGNAEAEDLLQSALVRAWIHRASFDGHGSSLGWFFSIIRNEHLETLRRSSRRRSLVGGLAGTIWSGLARFVPQTADECELELDNQVDASSVREAVQMLPEPARDVVFLCDFEEYTHEEAAHVLGVPIGTVKSRLHRAHSTLAGALRNKAQVGK